MNISNENVRKRISQARSILRKQFNEYLGEDNQPQHQLKQSSSSPKQKNFDNKEAIANDHLTLSEQNQKSLSHSPESNRVNQSNQKPSIEVNFKPAYLLRTWVSIDLNYKILALLVKKEGFLRLNPFNKGIDSS